MKCNLRMPFISIVFPLLTKVMKMHVNMYKQVWLQFNNNKKKKGSSEEQVTLPGSVVAVWHHQCVCVCVYTQMWSHVTDLAK